MGFWDKLKLSMPIFGGAPDKRSTPLTEDVAFPLPTSIGGLTDSSFYTWDDEIYNLDLDGYKCMRRSPIIYQPIDKLGSRIAALDLVVVGDGERAEAIQEIIDFSVGTPTLIKFMCWAYVEGVIFNQIKMAEAVEDGKGWIYPNFLGGGRHKANAGGTLLWDGNRVVKERQNNSPAPNSEQHAPAAEFDRSHFVIFRPGHGANPEGDFELPRVLLNLAKDYELCQKNLRAYADRHGLPREIVKKDMQKIAALRAQSELSGYANSVAQAKAGQTLGINAKDTIELLEPSGTTWQFLIEYKKELAGDAHKLILGQTLTSDTKDSGPAGSSQVHMTEEDRYVHCAAKEIADTLNRDLLPWILRYNPDIPLLTEGEREVYLQFQPEGEREGEQEDPLEIMTPGIMDTEGEVIPGGEGIDEAAVDPEGEPIVQESGEPEPQDEEVVAEGNPFKVIKQGNQYCVVKADTGELVPGGATHLKKWQCVISEHWKQLQGMKMPFKAEQVENGLLIKGVSLGGTVTKDERDLLKHIDMDIDEGWYEKAIHTFNMQRAKNKIGAKIFHNHGGPQIGRIENVELTGRWLYGDLLITNPDAIEKVKRGELVSRSLDLAPTRHVIEGVSLLDHEGHFDEDVEDLVIEFENKQDEGKITIRLQAQEVDMPVDEIHEAKMDEILKKLDEALLRIEKLEGSKAEPTPAPAEEDSDPIEEQVAANEALKADFEAKLELQKAELDIEKKVAHARANGSPITDKQYRNKLKSFKTEEGRAEYHKRILAMCESGGSINLADESDDLSPEDKLRAEFEANKDKYEKLNLSVEDYVKLNKDYI